MPSRFSTKEFSFNDQSLSLYRRIKIEEIPFDQITWVELKKGSDLKRPKVALVFGTLLILLCIKILSAYNPDIGEFFASGAMLRILSVTLFVGGIGVYSIYSAAPIHPIIEIRLTETTEKRSISSLVKAGSLGDFSDFLQGEFKTKFRNSLN